MKYAQGLVVVVLGALWGCATAAWAQGPGAGIEPRGLTGYEIPGAIGMLITFLGWSLKESYQARMKDQARVDAERVRESQESAERSRQEAKEFADRLEQIYRSNKDDTQRMYQEQRDLVSSLRASQDAHLEKLLGLAFAGGTAK